MPLMLLVISFVFSALIRDVWSMRSTSCASSCSLPARPSMSSANRKLVMVLPAINDRIATQRYLTPEISIGSPVMSRTTSEPSDGRSRKMVANVAGCRSFCTFGDCHTSIAFTPVGPQPNLAHIFGWIWD